MESNSGYPAVDRLMKYLYHEFHQFNTGMISRSRVDEAHSLYTEIKAEYKKVLEMIEAPFVQRDIRNLFDMGHEVLGGTPMSMDKKERTIQKYTEQGISSEEIDVLIQKLTDTLEKKIASILDKAGIE